MGVPHELTERNQWVVWRDEQGRKIPYQPSGEYAKSNDPTTWASLADCQAVVDRYSGIGFVFSADDPFCGVDLDNVYHDGEIADWAREIIERLDTYAEISPSGRGVKLWLRGQIPDGKGRKTAVDGGQGIEVYDRGRYFTFTGLRLFPDQSHLADCQDSLEAILAHYWPAPDVSPPPTFIPIGDVAERARLYLRSVPPAISGQDGHGHTIKVAANIVRGFDLSPEAAYHVIQEWNATCQPPWNEKELRHKLEDAAKHDGARGWLLEREDDGPPVDLSRILLGDPDDVPSLPAAPNTFPADCLRPPGLLSEIIDWNLSTALWPQPELALAGALALLGTITGRKVEDERRTRTNVYCLGLAASGAGKEHARAVNKQILLQCGADRMLGPEGLASSAGMVQFVGTHKSILFQLDEMGRLLETMREPRKAPHLFKIGSELMKLDSCSNSIYKGDAYANQKQTVIVNQPHACIYGTSVPDGFWRSLTEDNVSEGLLGRMFVFESSSRYVAINPQIAHTEPGFELVNGVHWWLEQPYGPGDLAEEKPTPRIVPYTDEARRRIDGHLYGICQKRATEDDTKAALWSRTTGKTAKLALLLACSRGTGQEDFEIELQDVNRAIKISNWLTRRMLWQAFRHVSKNEREGKAKSVYRLLADGMTRTELTRKTQWLCRRERDEILNELLDCGLVESTTIETATKPKTVLKAVAGRI